MRKPLIAANWKMNKTVSESASLIKKLKKSLKNVKNREIVVCPPFASLSAVSKLLKNSEIGLGAQNMHFADEGAFTGEISPLMLKELNCEYVILGHSERRQHFKEDDDLINKKVIAALKNNLKPILCIGETLKQRKNNQTFNIIKNQLINSLKNISENNILKVVIAYEPVWAIGTGVNATPKQAEEVHVFIRSLLSEKYDKKTAEETRVLYGGSVKPENIKDLMKEENIDGALVGGASLSAESFAKIVKY